MKTAMSKRNPAPWIALAAVGLAAFLVPHVSEAQSLGAIAAKEKKRRAENDKEAVRVIDDNGLATVSGDGLSVTGTEVEPETTPPPARSSSSTKSSGAKSAQSPSSKAACIEMANVERQIAQEKRLTSSRSSDPGFVGHPGRSTRGMITGVDSQGNREVSTSGPSRSARHPKPSTSSTTQAAAMRSEKLAGLRKRLLELRSQCRP